MATQCYNCARRHPVHMEGKRRKHRCTPTPYFFQGSPEVASSGSKISGDTGPEDDPLLVGPDSAPSTCSMTENTRCPNSLGESTVKPEVMRAASYSSCVTACAGGKIWVRQVERKGCSGGKTAHVWAVQVPCVGLACL